MKKWLWIVLVTAVCLVATCAVSMADDMVTLTGRVTDREGKPIEHATVMVYRAGVKKGYSTFCPSCYADCGKRAITDGNGTFTFKRLSPDLWFELLVARDGYGPAFAKKIDPSSGTPVTATLARRKTVSDPDRVFRGRIEDSAGRTVRDVVVQPVGLLLDSRTGSSGYGTIEGLDPVAISNEKGEFEIVYSKPGLKILVSVEARSMAPAFSVIPAGLERHAITIVRGATVRGRLVQDGIPVGDAEVGLNGRLRCGFDQNLELSGYPYDEIRIGTQPDGTFAITNVPAPVDCYIYSKMESVAARGATGTVECSTKHDNEIVDVGDIQIRPAHRLQGRVVLSDGKPIPDGMRVTISSERASDTQTAMLPPEGRFEFVGLATGSYSVFASVKGYTLPETPVSVEKKKEDGTVEITTYAPAVAPPFSIDQDVDGFVITLHPGYEASR